MFALDILPENVMSTEGPLVVDVSLYWNKAPIKEPPAPVPLAVFTTEVIAFPAKVPEDKVLPEVPAFSAIMPITYNPAV